MFLHDQQGDQPLKRLGIIAEVGFSAHAGKQATQQSDRPFRAFGIPSEPEEIICGPAGKITPSAPQLNGVVGRNNGLLKIENFIPFDPGVFAEIARFMPMTAWI